MKDSSYHGVHREARRVMRNMANRMAHSHLNWAPPPQCGLCVKGVFNLAREVRMGV